MVPWIALTWGWRAAFLVTGGVGIIWVACALFLFKPAGVAESTTEERDAEPGPSVQYSWDRVVRMRETWAFATAKLLTDPIWWFYLYWTPKYLSTQFGVQLAGLAAPLVVIYIMADVGSIGGGWASARLIRTGISPLSARKRVMLWCALLALLVVGAGVSPTLWLSVALLSIAAAAHQGWSANLFATVSDLFPKEAVASVVGIGGMLGALGGMVIATLAGLVLHYSGSYLFLFVVCSSAYVVAFALFSALTHRGVTARR
jgi:ACS family hexuronate transporter-like MFS transporter